MLTDRYELTTFTTDLRVVTSYYDLFTVYIRIITSYYGKINPWTLVRRFLTCQKFASPFTDVYELLRVVTSYLRIPASYLRMLAIDYELAIRKDS